MICRLWFVKLFYSMTDLIHASSLGVLYGVAVTCVFEVEINIVSCGG